MEIIAILLVAAGAFYLWSNRKPKVPYNPTREDVLIVLRKVFGGMNTELEWDTLTGVPMEKDPELESTRKKCADIDDNKENFIEPKEGFIFNEKGLLKIKALIEELEGYCKAAGRQKSEFQINCAQIVEHKMEQLGLKLATWDYVEGPEESYFLGELRGVQMYIYTDGAGIKSPQGSFMFENQEYKGESELTRVLISKFQELTATVR